MSGHRARERFERDLLAAVLVDRRDRIVLRVGALAPVEDVLAREHHHERADPIGRLDQGGGGVDVDRARRLGLPLAPLDVWLRRREEDRARAELIDERAHHMGMSDVERASVKNGRAVIGRDDAPSGEGRAEVAPDETGAPDDEHLARPAHWPPAALQANSFG